MTDRQVYRLTGADVLPFLQGMVSNDVLLLGKGPGLVWAALLSPQGKYLADFFIANTGEALLLDLPADTAEATVKRLGMYRLRADVKIEPVDIPVSRGVGAAPQGALPDPRHPDLGWRLYAPHQAQNVDWDAIRVRHVIPESGVELIANDSYLLETGFERLHGVDFRKGCYVGQEVTARMKHKTELRKGLVRVRLSAPVPVGTAVMAGDKEVGTVFTQSGGFGIAYLRFDRTDGPLTACDAVVQIDAGS